MARLGTCWAVPRSKTFPRSSLTRRDRLSEAAPQQAGAAVVAVLTPAYDGLGARPEMPRDDAGRDAGCEDAPDPPRRSRAASRPGVSTGAVV